MMQSPQEKQALGKAWLASPAVAARHAQLVAFAEHEHLQFDVEGMNLMTQFNALLNHHQGFLPDSGVKDL